MKAVVYHAFRQMPAIQELPTPRLESDAILVHVRATGLCRSDWHGWMGHDPDITLPHVPGHEFAGVVERIGTEVKNWKAGDRVTTPFVCACGDCRQCRSGNDQVCDRQTQPGFTHWGSFAEFVVVRHADHNVVRLPDDMEFSTAASLGCRFATSYRAVVDQGRVREGEWLAVFGCGGVGLSAIMIARALGARVLAVDVATQALELAREIGATEALDARERDPVAAIAEISGGGAHVSIDALGSAKTSYQSISCLRKRGRHVQVGLIVEGDADSLVPMARVVADELEIVGSHGIQASRYASMLEFIERNALRPERLIGSTIALDDAPAALAAMDESAVAGITVIEPG